MDGFIYVAQGAKILKVGRTTNVQSRKRSIAKEFSKFADAITEFAFFGANGHAHAAEIKLLCSVQKTHKQYMGREWFAAGDFEQVCLEAKSACESVKALPVYRMKELSPKQLLELKTQREEVVRRKQQEREGRKLKREQEAKQKKLIRILRGIELHCIAMWNSKANKKQVSEV